VPGLQRAGRAAARDRARRARRFDQRREHDLVGICEPRPLTGERAHADTAVDAVRTVLDDAVFERPGLFTHRLEVDIGVVDRVSHHLAEDPGDPVLVKGRRGKNRVARRIERVGMDRRDGWRLRRREHRRRYRMTH
jgi:hypothetical protein